MIEQTRNIYNGSGTASEVYARYSYLGAGTIVAVEHPAVQGGLTLSYDPDGDHSYGGWDRFGRIIDQKWTDGAGTTTLDEFTYTYDRSSNRLTRTNALNDDFSEAYTYDALDRLIDTNRDAADYQSWNLDQLGNWAGFTDQGSTQTRTHNAANEIGTISGQLDWIDPAYDSAGNMISGPKAGDEDTRLHFVYDPWNRMTEVRADDSGEPGDPVAAYEYDGANRRIEKTVGSSTSDFYYNEGWQVVEVRQNDDPDPLDQYVWDIRYIDAPAVRFHDGNTDGDYADAGDNTLYATNDANMNVTALVDGDGTAVRRYVYDAHGRPTSLNPETWAAEADSQANAVLYCGYWWDADAGVYHVRHRIYLPHLGRWGQPDHIGQYVDGMNRYEYVTSGPTRATDPTGREMEVVPCGGNIVKVETTNCCWPRTPYAQCEACEVWKALCSAQKTLNVAKNKVASLRGPWPTVKNPGLRPDPYDYFENYFHPQSGPWVAVGSKSAEDLRQEAVEIVMAAYWKVIQSLASGVKVHCGLRNEEGWCKGGGAYGYAVLGSGEITLCGAFFTRGRPDKTRTVLHELLHAVVNSTDEAFSGRRSGTYVLDPVGTTDPHKYTKGRDWRPLDPMRHADSLAMFAMIYQVP